MHPEGLAQASGQGGLRDQGVAWRRAQPLGRPVGIEHARGGDPGVLCHHQPDTRGGRDPVADARHFFVAPVTVGDGTADQRRGGGQYLVHPVEQTELKPAET